MNSIHSKHRFSKRYGRTTAFFAFATQLSCLGLDAAPMTPPPAAPSSEEPMRIVVVRSAEPECEPKCAEWISAEGKLNPETVAEFQKIVNATRGHRLPVLINSNGGSVGAGLAIGRIIRSRQLDVAVSKTDIKPCDAGAKDCPVNPPLNISRGLPHSRGAICASSCIFILAAGFHRFVAPWSSVGVHEVTAFQRQPLTFEEAKSALAQREAAPPRKPLPGEKVSPPLVMLDAPTAQTEARIAGYFREMGITDQLHQLMIATGPKDIHWLSHAELGSTHMATDYYGGEALVAQSGVFPLANPNASTPDASQIGRRAPDFKMEVTSFGYGIVKMPGFDKHDAMVLLEFLRRKDVPTIEMSALVEAHEGFVPTGNLSFAVQFGRQKHSAMIETEPASAIAPLFATIQPSEICVDMPFSSAIKLTFVHSAQESKTAGAPAYFEMQSLASMRDFLADVCKK